nr:hypothetical protein [Tanacetum cinerariifolium]
MDGINIEDLIIEQYLWLTQEKHTSSMVKKVDDMAITEYIEYEKRIKRQYSKNYDMELDEECGYTTNKESAMSKHEAIDPVHAVNTQSFEEELSSEEDLDEWDVYKNKQIRVAEADLKKSSEVVEDTVNLGLKMASHLRSNYTAIYSICVMLAMVAIIAIRNLANINASNNVMHVSIYEYLKLANLGGAAMSVEMDDMTQQETLGTVKNVLVKINNFEFPCDFVVTAMPENLGEMIILGRPFLETIHAQIDVFQEEISKRKLDGICRLSSSSLRKSENDDATREWRYYEWVVQNYEIDNNRTTSATTVSDKCPYKTNYPTHIPPDKWVPAARRQHSRPTRPVIAW